MVNNYFLVCKETFLVLPYIWDVNLQLFRSWRQEWKLSNVVFILNEISPPPLCIWVYFVKKIAKHFIFCNKGALFCTSYLVFGIKPFPFLQKKNEREKIQLYLHEIQTVVANAFATLTHEGMKNLPVFDIFFNTMTRCVKTLSCGIQKYLQVLIKSSCLSLVAKDDKIQQDTRRTTRQVGHSPPTSCVCRKLPRQGSYESCR